MCFLKALRPLDTLPSVEEGIDNRVTSQNIEEKDEKNYSYLNSLLATKVPILQSKQDQLLFNLLATISSNNTHLEALDQKLNHNESQISSFLESFESTNDQASPEKKCKQLEDLESEQTLNSEEYASTSDPLVEKMFGKKKYRYRLQINGDTPSLIYKERNINISVQLINKETEKILNSNIIHLCLGLCDSNGEWVTENKAGENFMKGKTEVEMYHGEGSFLKVYPRQVSRGYPNGKLNFVIYAKPSVLRFMNSNSSVESEVDSNLIEPLVLKDICIRAKKKE